VLTFDDGLIEHAEEVWPRLRSRGWTGAFFASASATLERRFLDVHRIHLLLASGIDPHRLKTELLSLLGDHTAPDVPTAETLWTEYGHPSRFDPAEVIFFKRVLQKGLPERVRVAILDTLFRRHISEDEASLADEFYLSLDDLAAMAADGMEIGGHGIRHEWLDVATDLGRAREIHGTMELLSAVHGGHMPNRWFFAYPYGAYNRRTMQLLEGAGCSAALTVEVDLATRCSNPMELPRIDANDLPFDAFADIAEWTVRADADVSMPATQ
jgi:peptidoglycan/xylan/chitin deacetylase (PgdA/CDA1 family)